MGALIAMLIAAGAVAGSYYAGRPVPGAKPLPKGGAFTALGPVTKHGAAPAAVATTAPREDAACAAVFPAPMRAALRGVLTTPPWSTLLLGLRVAWAGIVSFFYVTPPFSVVMLGLGGVMYPLLLLNLAVVEVPLMVLEYIATCSADGVLRSRARDVRLLLETLTTGPIRAFVTGVPGGGAGLAVFDIVATPGVTVLRDIEANGLRPATVQTFMGALASAVPHAAQLAASPPVPGTAPPLSAGDLAKMQRAAIEAARRLK